MFTLSTARALRASNAYVHVYVVSVSGADATKLYAVASDTALVFLTGNFRSTELTELQNNVTREYCVALILPVSK